MCLLNIQNHSEVNIKQKEKMQKNSIQIMELLRPQKVGA